MDNYPFTSPRVYFKTPIYHPNVEKEDGCICQALIRTGEYWAPVKRLRSLIEKILLFMVNPIEGETHNGEAILDFTNGTWRAKAKQATDQLSK